MRSEYTQLEYDVLENLLKGNHPVLDALRNQLSASCVRRRECTGVGFFTEICIPDSSPRVPGKPSLRFGDVIADVDGLQYGAGFLLFVDEGKMTGLEGYTFGEAWPAGEFHYELHYSGKDGTRDLSDLEPPSSDYQEGGQ